jgi:hypothetical protein
MSARPESRKELRIEFLRKFGLAGFEFREMTVGRLGKFGRVTVVENEGGGGKIGVENECGGEI